MVRAQTYLSNRLPPSTLGYPALGRGQHSRGLDT